MVTFEIYKDEAEQLFQNGLTYSLSLPELAGKRVTLSYTPATQADIDTLNSFLPAPHADGSPIGIEEFPSSLPAYLINVKPQIWVDGLPVVSGNSVTLGSSETLTLTLNGPGSIGSEKITNTIVGGEFYGIILNPAGVSPSQLAKIRDQYQVVKAKIDSNNFDGLTKDDVMGQILYGTAAIYYGYLDFYSSVVSKATGIIYNRLPSEGSFSTTLSIDYLFGIPETVSPGGYTMDIDLNSFNAFAKDGNLAARKTFVLEQGTYSSSLEHTVPEITISSDQEPVHGISAVKAIEIANNQGIPIYTITQANSLITIPQLQLGQEIVSEITDAVNAGLEVEVSKSPVDFMGNSITGYIITNPVTGEGAYRINGGVSGAFIIVGLIIAVGALILSIFAGPIIAPLLIALSAVNFLGTFYNVILDMSDEEWANFKNCAEIGFAAISLLFGFREIGLGTVSGTIEGMLHLLAAVFEGQALSDGGCK